MSRTDRPPSNHSRGEGATCRPGPWYRWPHARMLTVLLVFVTVVLALAALETVTRFIYRDITTTGDNRSYFVHKWLRQNPPSLNRYGFRERDFSPIPLKDTYRIAVIGDSFTYGQGIPESDRMTNLLEAYLNRPDSLVAFEVLNFGRSGTDTSEHVRFLNDYVLRIKPNFVLLQWFVNDVRNDRSMRYRALPLVPWRPLHRFLATRSALFYLINHGWVQLQHLLRLVETEEHFMIRYFGDANSWPAGPLAERCGCGTPRAVRSCRSCAAIRGRSARRRSRRTARASLADRRTVRFGHWRFGSSASPTVPYSGSRPHCRPRAGAAWVPWRISYSPLTNPADEMLY
jgi:hypothetical protein